MLELRMFTKCNSEKNSFLIGALLVLMIAGCHTISVLDSRNINIKQRENRSVVFGSITLIHQKVPKTLSEKSWFSFTLKNINTGESFTLVDLPREGRYYLALEPGEYTIKEWSFGTGVKSLKCQSKDLYFYLHPQSFAYLGDMVINMGNNGKIDYQIKDDFDNASYFFYERFPGFFPQLTRNFIQVKTNMDYYF